MNKILYTILFIGLILFGYFVFKITSYEAVSVVTTKPTPTTEPIPTKIPLSAENLTRLVNEWRVSQGYQPYIEDERLCKIAVDRSDEGVDNHQGFIEKIESNYYGFTTEAIFQENLVQASDSENALVSWLNSPSHRSTLEKPYKYTCIACSKNQCNQIFSNF